MRELDYTWSSNTSSGAQTAVEVHGDLIASAWYFRSSTGVATATISVQSAPTASGPWFDEGGSTAVTSGIVHVVRVAGPMGFARPFCGSTGITVRAIGVS